MPIRFVGSGEGNSPEELFRRIPPISKGLAVAMVCMLFSQTLEIFSAYHFALVWPLVWERFHVWRIFTCLVFPGQPSFMTLFHIFVTISYSMRYEKDGFSTGGGGGSADYAFMLLFGLIVMETVELLLFYSPFVLFGNALYFYVCYVWSRKHPRMSVSFFGIAITAVYVPWVMLSISILLGSSIHMPLLGIAVGHLYYFLVDVLPDLHDIDLLRTPKFLVGIFGWGTEGSGVRMERPSMPAPGAVQPPRDVPSTGRRSNWGRGRTLGSS